MLGAELSALRAAVIKPKPPLAASGTMVKCPMSKTPDGSAFLVEPFVSRDEWDSKHVRMPCHPDSKLPIEYRNNLGKWKTKTVGR